MHGVVFLDAGGVGGHEFLGEVELFGGDDAVPTCFVEFAVFIVGSGGG